MQAGSSLYVHTLYGVDTTDSGYKVPTPIPGSTGTSVNGRPAVVTTQGSAHTIAFEIDATRESSSKARDDRRGAAHRGNASGLAADRPTVALVAAEHQPSGNPKFVQYPIAWVAVGLDSSSRPCVAIVPSNEACAAIDGAPVGGTAANMMAAGWAGRTSPGSTSATTSAKPPMP